MYFDTCYLAKFYVNEPESQTIREIVREAPVIHSSLWALAEFHTALHRHLRENALSSNAVEKLLAAFSDHLHAGLWKLIPVNEPLLRRASARIISAPSSLFIRTADAIHLTTARDIGEQEIWTNDRHMLSAASHFGLTGRSIPSR